MTTYHDGDKVRILSSALPDHPDRTYWCEKVVQIEWDESVERWVGYVDVATYYDRVDLVEEDFELVESNFTDLEKENQLLRQALQKIVEEAEWPERNDVEDLTTSNRIVLEIAKQALEKM